MTEVWGTRILKFMMAVCAYMAINYTFFDQVLINALVSISSFFTFRFLLQNPKMMMSKSYKEFGEHADNANNLASFYGSPAYFASVFFCVLYIIVF